MEKLNITYIKSFITKFAKDTGAKLELDIYNDNRDAMIHFNKGNTMIHVHLNEADCYLPTFKYDTSVLLEQTHAEKIQFGFRTKSLNEIVQLCNLLLCTIDRVDRPLELRALIKASHWGIKLVTVENSKGYRANLYVSDALYMLIHLGYVKIHGINIERKYENPSKYTLRAKFDKSVLNYDKIQKEGNWNKYIEGFDPIKQFPDGDDYIHPSLTWQKGKLF